VARNTIQRQLIFNAVKTLNIHASAEQVYDYLTADHPSISKATVYRNLSQMSESGELLNIGVFDGAVHYDHNCHNHYHFICYECKKIFDVEADLTDIFDRTKNQEGFDIYNTSVSFNGICWECKDKLVK